MLKLKSRKIIELSLENFPKIPITTPSSQSLQTQASNASIFYPEYPEFSSRINQSDPLISDCFFGWIDYPASKSDDRLCGSKTLFFFTTLFLGRISFVS
jgi:hypothetical protein